MPNTVESAFYIYFNTHNTSLWGRFIIIHKKKLKYRKVNKWFVQGYTTIREWWHRSLNLWRLSWEPRCPTSMFSFLTRYNHIPWEAPTLVKKPEQLQIIKTVLSVLHKGVRRTLWEFPPSSWSRGEREFLCLRNHFSCNQQSTKFPKYVQTWNDENLLQWKKNLNSKMNKDYKLMKQSASKWAIVKLKFVSYTR